MKTETHVKYIVGKCYQCLWAIRKLKQVGVEPHDILRFFNLKIRSVLESSSPAFHSMLTVDDSNQIERIQKITLKIILGSRYETYLEACKILDIESLKSRREKLTLNFGLKLVDSMNCETFFNFTEKSDIFLRKQPVLKVPFAHTDRYKNSPLPYITNLLNIYFDMKISEKDFVNIPSRFFPITLLQNGL